MEQQSPIESVSKTAWHMLTQDRMLYASIIIMTLVVVVDGWLFISHSNLLLSTSPRDDLFVHLAYYILLGSLALVGGRIWFIFGRVQKEFMRQFAVSIGFFYTPSGPTETQGKLFSIGHSHRTYNMLSGTYQSYPVRIFTYSFTVGSGKQQHSYTYTVCEATGSTQFPDITLTSKQNGFLANPHVLSFSDEHIQLEGDFNKYFTLTVPKNYEQEAYEILTPDVMASLIDKAKKLNFEFVGDKIYVYVEHEITTRAELQELFDATSFLIPLFEKSAPKA